MHIRSGLLPVGVLALFLLGFCTLGSLYPFGLKNGDTVVLGQALAEEDRGADGFRLTRVMKHTVAHPVYNVIPVDEERIVFSDSQSASQPINIEGRTLFGPSWVDPSRIGIMRVSDGQTDFLDDVVLSGSASLSPDRTRLLYSRLPKESSVGETVWIELASGEERGSFTGASFSNLFIGPERFLGVAGDELLIQELSQTGIVVGIPFHRMEIQADFWHTPRSAGDVGQFYLLAQHNGEADLYRFETGKQAGISKVMGGSRIEDYSVMDRQRLVYRGGRDGSRGLYAFDGSTGRHALLREGTISSFHLDASGRKVAYAVQAESGIWELHAAWLGEGTLEGDRLIYGGLRSLDSVSWSPDGSGIFCVSKTMEGSTIYRFSLN